MTVRAEELQLGELAITVREMTVGEMRTWWAEREAEERATAEAESKRVAEDAPEEPADSMVVFEHLLAGAKLPLSDLRRMCSLDEAGIDKLSQAELGQLEAACEKLNPRFFALRQQLTRTVEQLLPSTKP